MEIKLEDFEGKFLVLVFYPQDFTFICPTEVIAFGNRASEFEKINCSIVACSTDSLACHRGKYLFYHGVVLCEAGCFSDQTSDRINNEFCRYP